MKFIVKNTTFCGVFDLLCPHYCRGCGAIGSILCECCKKNIINQKMCSKIIMCGFREGLLGDLIKEYKYNSLKAAGDVLVDLLDTVIPCLSDDAVIVPLPTISRHIRERGFDHIWVIARKLAKRRQIRALRVLGRAKNTVQVGATAEQRIKQAENAYRLIKKIEIEKEYVLLDDVWTTGASMMAAEKILRKAGVKNIQKVVIAVSR